MNQSKLNSNLTNESIPHDESGEFYDIMARFIVFKLSITINPCNYSLRLPAYQYKKSVL